MAGPVYAVVFLLAEPLTRMWLRHSFSPTVPGTLRIFLIGTFFSLIGTPFYYGLIGAGRAQGVLYANVIQFAVNIAGVYFVLNLLKMTAGTELYAVLGIADCALGISTAVLLAAMRGTLRSKMKLQLQLDTVAA
jgi:O-antigen/teichoic acid export membrane protein